ncbi:uncharacterized protein K452DRAFT_351392 [Aplosporella prunicola CBS 121167]|uniref:ATP synthase subunit 5, mitochondrial n=1 Tax=Aplosporella prunicola CBS 121167 TaxID=1176127 RepID=A0A6A6BAI4_9PEZI|nr:uncharacterized protein K452DRAFT_351392 [Aplosporella prunicola CBS 121167]KAF2141219.1 hypothetical protein K452DRAFT_351392 [Aplosporella prunicola CBS 121167]
MFTARAVAQTARSAAPRAAIAPRTVLRSYAQAAPASTRPPVALYGVDGTYASALYTASAKTSSLDGTSKALDSLAGVFKKDAKLAEVLASPTLKAEDKKAVVAELSKYVGADKEGIVKNFLETLAENNRLSVLVPVTEKFAQLMSAYRGEVELTITSAAPLDNKTLSRLESAISKSQYAGEGKKLKVVSKVNPDIRGGLVVEIGDRTIDLSVSSKLAKMNKLLQDTL